MGRRGAVASNHPLATQAGLLQLQAGGNAVDAAVAVAATLSVVEPYMSGLGGDGFYHVFAQDTGEALVFNGTGPAPLAATPARYAGGLPLHGPLAASVPGAVAGWGAMHARFGRRPWSALFDAAVHYAREGYGATAACRHFAGENLAALRADPRSARIFLRDGEAPPVGTPIVQRDLAWTLECLAADGAESLYRGRLAGALAAGCREIGALPVLEDLAAFDPEVQLPVETTYRGLVVRQAPPNSMGWTLLEELNIVECFDLRRMGLLSAELVHTLVEAKKLAFADRERWSGDPRAVDIPLGALLDKAYAARLAARIGRRAAAPVGRAPASVPGDTTYFCVVDGAGNAVSGIQSLNSAFGSGAIAGDTGILLNNRMAPWHLEPGHPNCLAPGRRVRHTMNTPLVFRDGSLWGVLGTPGGDAQVQVNLQVLTAMIDLGLDPQQAAEMPRWASTQPGQEANWPHECPDALTLEARFPPAVRDELAARGHRLVMVGDLDGPCSVEIIRREAGTGMLVAGSDPRRDGWALAY
jgi:gamma-glutamyltranspeptidase/glutathione hydrolase